MSKTQGNRLIAAAETAEILTPFGVIPQHESVARPLTKLPPEVQPLVWQQAVAAAKGKVTAVHVEQVVREYVTCYILSPGRRLYSRRRCLYRW